MDLEYDNDEEIKVLGEPHPKTDEERGEWLDRYYNALNNDLGGNDCQGCDYFQAIIWRPDYEDVYNNDNNKGAPSYFDEDLWCMVYDPIYDDDEKSQDNIKPKDEHASDDSKGVYLCEECAKYVSERLNEIQKNIEDKGLGEKTFKDSWLYWCLIIYGTLSGIIVFAHIFNAISKMLRNI